MLVAIDHTPADALIQQLSPTISAATSGWRDAYLPLVVGDGPVGTMVTIQARRPDGSIVTTRAPRLARSKYFDAKREDRPANGTEVSPGVYYLDLANIDEQGLSAVLPKLAGARGVIGDLRDGASHGAFHILAHFIDHEIKSPYWDTPIASVTGRHYERQQLSIFPSTPRLATKLVLLVDGRTASSPETILQYARGAGIGYVIGEPTGGTNGNVAEFTTLGELVILFTGMRVLNQDGSLFHGQGITPDLIVHPTLDSLRAGHDVLIDAAIARIASP
jgi:C-terminal processing protease CtpA/Prc